MVVRGFVDMKPVAYLTFGLVLINNGKLGYFYFEYVELFNG
jgi:hypothetical protein